MSSDIIVKVSNPGVVVRTATVGGSGGTFSIQGASDTDIINPANGEALLWDSDINKWVAGNVAASISLNDTIISTSTTEAATANSVNAVYNYSQSVENIASGAFTQANTAEGLAENAETLATASFNEANSFQSVINSAFATANVAFGAYAVANTALNAADGAFLEANSFQNVINSSYATANVSFSAFSEANSFQSVINTSYATANVSFSAYAEANAASALATAANNLATSHDAVINSAYATANVSFSAYANANAALAEANSFQSVINTSYATANVAFTAYAQANIAYNEAVGAFNEANSFQAVINSSYSTANVGFSAYANANAALAEANSFQSVINTSYATANVAFSAYANANAALAEANSFQGVINSAYTLVNSHIAIISTIGAIANQASANANAAFSEANSFQSVINSAYATANVSFSAYANANAALAEANSFQSVINTAYATANVAFSAYANANAALAEANSFQSIINTIGSIANTAAGGGITTIKFVANAGSLMTVNSGLSASITGTNQTLYLAANAQGGSGGIGSLTVDATSGLAVNSGSTLTIVGNNTVVLTGNAASTTQVGVVQLTDNTMSNSTTTAATANAVNTTWAYAQSAFQTANTAMGGYALANTQVAIISTIGAIANQASANANAAFAESNSFQAVINSAYATANVSFSAYANANAALAEANSFQSIINSAFARANTIDGIASLTINTANGLTIDALTSLTITANATIALSVNLGNTTEAGIVQLVDNTWSNSITMAATANSVNTTWAYAQSAFNLANTLSTDITIIQGVESTQNTDIADAWANANAALAEANSFQSVINTSYATANVSFSAYANANAALAEANSFQSIINSAYAQANAATNSAQAAYNKANSGGTGGALTVVYDATSGLSVNGGSTLTISGNGTAVFTGNAATTSQVGVVQLYDGEGSNSTTLAATANSVNTTWAYAQSAFMTANTAMGGYALANTHVAIISTIGEIANQASANANAALAEANSFQSVINTSYATANVAFSAYANANAALAEANSFQSVINSAFATANVSFSAYANANAALAEANSFQSIINSAFATANVVHTAYANANAALAEANSFQSVINTSYATANVAFSAFAVANAAVTNTWPGTFVSNNIIANNTVTSGYVSVNYITTNYTIQPSDSGKVLICSNTSAIVLTIANTLCAYGNSGFRCLITNANTGNVSFTNTTNTIVNTTAVTPWALPGQYYTASLFAPSSNTFILDGVVVITEGGGGGGGSGGIGSLTVLTSNGITVNTGTSLTLTANGTLTLSANLGNTKEAGIVQLNDTTSCTSTTLAATANSVNTVWSYAQSAFQEANIISTSTYIANQMNLTLGVGTGLLALINGVLVSSSEAIPANSTVLFATNVASTTTQGIVQLKDVLTSTATTYAPTANMANYLEVQIVAVNQYAQSAYALANVGGGSGGIGNPYAGTFTANELVSNTYANTACVQINNMNTAPASGTYSLSMTDSGTVIVYNNTNPLYVNTTNACIEGFRCIVSQVNTGMVTIRSDPYTNLIPRVPGNTAIAGPNCSVSIVSWSPSTFLLDGSIASIIVEDNWTGAGNTLTPASANIVNGLYTLITTQSTTNKANYYSGVNGTQCSSNSTTAFTMQGLGATITPRVTGNLDVSIQGTIGRSCTTITIKNTFYTAYGTGTAPGNNAPVTGTKASANQYFEFGVTAGDQTAADIFIPFSQSCIITGLSLGTNYWVDLAAICSTASNGPMSNVTVAIAEF